jgi:thioredoxin-dependent peroxiredoxin
VAACPRVGDPAPDFELPGTGGRSYSLHEYRGTPVVLVFYPGDNTAVCTTQLNAYSSDIDQFEGLGAQVLAVSPQDVASHEQFSCKQGGFTFPLLADVDKEVGRAYAVVGPLGFYKRSVFVIDAEGVVRYAHRSAHGLTFKRTDELVAALRATTP